MGSTGRRRRVTRNDVAAAAGVSPAVVSYVINDGPRNVAASTRSRVLAAIEELGYRPNANARALRLSSTNTIGVVLPNIHNSFFAELASELEQVAYEAGLALLIGNSNEDPIREERYIRNFVERQVDGILLVTVGGHPPLTAVMATQTPIVLLDRPQTSADNKAPFVGIDNRDAARVITEHLINHGHRRIACIAGPKNQIVALAREDGWKDALTNAGLPHDDTLLERAPFDIEAGFDAALRLFRKSDATAIFVSSDSQTQGLIAAARRSGVRIPENIAVVSFDGTRQSKFSDPQVTVITQPLAKIARTALDTLKGGWPASTPVDPIPFQLTIRDSCGCSY